MKPVVFYKMEASANDFVVVDNRRVSVRRPKEFARRICERHRGVGSDGLLLVERSTKAALKMRIFNADGSEAEMCGNGSRCVALYAHKVLGLPAKFTMETLAGLIGAAVKGDSVRVRLSDPKGFKSRATLTVDGEAHPFYFVNAGVPHTILFVEDLENYPVGELGEKIRFHKEFLPGGTNVDFVQCNSDHLISVRTYERGVGETQACGTGVTASAVVSVLAGWCKTPVRVKTLGGEILRVDFRREGYEVTDLYLEGRAQFVFEGKMRP